MNAALHHKDLVVLVADSNQEFAIRGLLSRPQSLRIVDISYDIFRHPQHDPGCLCFGHDFLRILHGRYRYSLIVFDRVGCGKESSTREELEREVEDSLCRTGWEDRSAAIAIDPELEAWVWSDSPEVDAVLGWESGPFDSVRHWLANEGLSTAIDAKPHDPKDAFEAVLRIVRRPRSSAIYQQLAERVSVNRCTDEAFAKLRTQLRLWFPRTLA